MTRRGLGVSVSAILVLACAPRGPSLPPSATPNLSAMRVTDSSDQTSAIDLRNESSVAQHIVAGSISQVWAVLPSVFEQLQIQLTRVDSSQGVMGNPDFRTRRIEGQRLSRYLDCGRSFGREYADQYSVTLGVLVQLVPTADGGTAVRTVLDAYAHDPGTSGNAVHCITWGSLERRIGELVAERLER